MSAGRFDWDEANRNHLAAHDITPEEVEQVFSRFTVEEAQEPVDGELRIQALGMTAKGRFLALAFTERNGKIRPITGWNMTKKELRKYAKNLSDYQTQL